MKCAVDPCQRSATIKGLCQTHYCRKRQGRPLMPKVVKCPHCGEMYRWLELVESKIPPHVYPADSRHPCPGIGQTPRNAEGDNRPLWCEETP